MKSAEQVKTFVSRMCLYESFLSFFQSLLSDGTIPQNAFQVIVYYDDNISGKHIRINETTVCDPIFDYLRNSTKAKVLFTSLMIEYTCIYNKEWEIQTWSRSSLS